MEAMREDMEYISGVLDELEAIVQDASRVPMRRGRAVVDRADLLVMLDELRGSLPAELSEAESIRRECAAVVAAAEEEARRIVEDAHERAEASVLDTELYRRSQRRAAETIDRAERYAREIEGGSEVYRDRVMGQLENWFEDSLVSVGESRQELTSSSPALTKTTRPAEPAPVEEQEGEEDSEDGQGWRASSA
ncbi:hypothetical protein GBA65_14395 [Rubrobacter marinus]|uniref:ATPase n=1 Tax=Rubrobacter marinus TaxID=2653852 RepID=A0A6G8PZ88_9ACTN|nr:hypothetical protein [Rubrobacter marinus]QIN79512.1 hypothetical protein GBA65_14395 [Rubrobacter marinus]